MDTIIFSIQGMTCGGCVNSVKRALGSLPGIMNIEVSLDAGQAKVEFDPGLVTVDRMKAAVRDAGYDVPN